MIPDSRLLQIWPLAPTDEKGLLEWARKLMVKLTSTKTDLYNVFTAQYASAIEYSPSYANGLKVTLTGDLTLTAKIGRVGPVWIILTNDSGVNHTTTFSTGFSSAGALVGTTSKTAVLEFFSDGETLWEVSRKTGL